MRLGSTDFGSTGCSRRQGLKATLLIPSRSRHHVSVGGRPKAGRIIETPQVVLVEKPPLPSNRQDQLAGSESAAVRLEARDRPRTQGGRRRSPALSPDARHDVGRQTPALRPWWRGDRRWMRMSAGAVLIAKARELGTAGAPTLNTRANGSCRL